MPDIDDDALRGPYSRAVVIAADELRDDVDHSRVPWSDHILGVRAGEDDEVEPTEIMIKVRPGYLRAVQSHFQRHPVHLDIAEPGPFGDAELVIFAEPVEAPFVPPSLDPATMIGRDVNDAERELLAAGWLVRRGADDHPGVFTADFNPRRVNLLYRSDQTAQGRMVYGANVS